jgi:hypothetical protein
MFSASHLRGRHGWAGLALVALLSGPATAQKAEMLVLRNETQMALVIQVTSVFRGTVQRARPFQLNPRTNSQPITLPGDKVIVIYDARMPSRTLFRDAIPASPQNQAFVIEPDTVAPKLRLRSIPFPQGGH